MSLLKSFGGAAAARAAPAVTGQAVRSILERAIDGVGPVGSAAKAADAQLRRAGGNVDDAISALISSHIRMAGAQGFVTNVGGLITVSVALPANIAAVALLQCHLAAGIVHLRGYSLGQPEIRDVILVCLLDADARKAMSRATGLEVTPTALLTGDHPPELVRRIARAVTAQILTAAGGKRLASFAARRIPVLGGAVGGVGDAWSTRRIGWDTARLPPNPLRSLTIDA